MSEDTPSSLYTDEEYADMIQCYLISGKKLELTQMCYANKYPTRRKPKLHTLKIIVQKYLDSLVTNNTANLGVNVTVCSKKDERIVDYFIKNSHATVEKAAHIFSVETSYIDQLLKKQKLNIVIKGKEDDATRRQERSVKLLSKMAAKQEKSNSDSGKSEADDEATTSTTTNNLLCEITMNESQDDGNCSETIKSETDDEVMCREIEYTKKRNKKYSKRSGIKKLKSSEDIISETQDVAVYSEATTSKLTDNLLREITMNVSQDIGNCSETAKSETDDEVKCREIEYTKKRKKKYSKRGSKKPKKIEKRKHSSQDPKTLELSRTLNAIVYTTRLEEMAILHKKIKHLDNATIMNDILWESKPKYNYWEDKSNIKEIKTMSYKTLKTILKKLKKNFEVVDLTDKVVDDDLIITDVIYPETIITLNAEDTKGRSNKSDVVIVINNLFSNLRDIYVTDWKCDLIEYCCTKLNDKCDLNKFDKTKIRLILDACCWIKRHRKVESIWPKNVCKFFRFLITIHKCPPDKCNCCCKPKQSTTDVTLYKLSGINDFTKYDSYSKSCDKNKNLILNALRYKKPDTKKNIKTCFERQNIPCNIVYLFKDTSKAGDYSLSRKECFEIGRNQDIVRFHAENYWHAPHQKCYQCFNMKACKRSAVVEIIICCKWKLTSILIEQYKACNITANTLKFLKGMLSRDQHVCNCCQYLLSACDLRPSTNQISNLIVNIPEVEHTRKLVKTTLLKIGFIDKTSSRIHNTVNKVARQILQETKYAHKDSAIQTTKTPSAVNLKVTCNQIPGLDFELDNVSYQLATTVVAKLTNMKFTVKEDLKVVASLNNPIQTTSTEEFQIIARILVHTQKCLKLKPLSPESDIDLVAKIGIPSDLENINNRESFFSPFKNVNKSTITVGESDNNITVKPTELAILKVLQAFAPSNVTKPTTKNLFQKLSNTDLISNKNQKFGTGDNIEITDDSCSYQNNAHKLKNEEQPSTKTSRRKNQNTYCDKVDKTKGRGENSSENKIQVHDVVCLNFSSDHFGSDISDINYDEAYTSKLKPYDGLVNVMRCSKKCYAGSFKSFLKDQKIHFETESLEVEKSIVLPKISSVFSLQSSAQQTQKETKEPVTSTSKADNASNNFNTETAVPTTSNNENTNVNRLNAGTISAGRPLMLYDPIQKITQIVCLTPNGLLVPVAHSLNTINPPINEHIMSREPITIPENNSDVAILTPIIVNQICDGNMAFMPAMQPIQENSILPDIINDIPKNIDLLGGGNNAIVVKQEAKDDVVVLDSD